MVPQAALHIAEICAQLEINQVILSPGSRNAPLTLAFSRHPQINTRIVPDERSAAYIALGMAQQLRAPVVVVCTSGTALLNYGPAVAEAFYQEVPLIVISADRPPEWIDQRDGQTIRQDQVFNKHTKYSVTLPVDAQHVHIQEKWHQLVNEALNTAMEPMPGPVHINVPFREPFYPKPDQPWDYTLNKPVIPPQSSAVIRDQPWDQLQQQWQAATKPLLIAGQHDYTDEALSALIGFRDHYQIPLLGDGISNLQTVPEAVKHVELIYNQEMDELQPDFIITWGKSAISKNLKKYLRKNPPQYHWHLQAAGTVADPFQTQPQMLKITPEAWFSERLLSKQHHESWYQLWQELEQAAITHLEQNVDFQHWSELSAAAFILKNLNGVDLHLANSMPVRWADLFGLEASIPRVWANRGTSGIDGCNSTAVGHSWFSKRLQVLLTGDMAFRYDRNAFWHQYSLKNLSIIILNNQGGGIFRLIDGPADQPELEEFFVTQQNYQAAAMAEEMGAQYLAIGSFEELDQGLKQLHASKQPLVLEVMVNGEDRDRYKNLKNFNNK